MFNFWTKERNKLLTENLESELIIKTIFEHSCSEFFNFLKTEKGNNEIINQITHHDYLFHIVVCISFMLTHSLLFSSIIFFVERLFLK